MTPPLPTSARVWGRARPAAGAGAPPPPGRVASAPAPPSGGLWMDRRERPTAFLGRYAPSEEDRRLMWQWVAQAVALS